MSMNCWSHAMNVYPRMLIASCAALCLAAALPAQAGPGGGGGARGGYSAHGGSGGHGGGYRGGYRGHGGYGHRGYGYGWGAAPLFLGALGLGLGLNALYGSPAYAAYPEYVYVEPQPLLLTEPPLAAPAPAQSPAPGTSAQAQAALVDPVIYPRSGQSAAQLDKDRHECVQWAAAQPRALADASVYQRAILACMDGRGYTLR